MRGNAQSDVILKCVYDLGPNLKYLTGLQNDGNHECMNNCNGTQIQKYIRDNYQ